MRYATSYALFVTQDPKYKLGSANNALKSLIIYTD